MLRLLSIQILAAVLLTVGARADDAATYKKWHDACVSGDSASIDTQIKKYEGRIAKNKKDYLAQAYLGSACALRAKESFWGTTKLKYLKRGKKILDGAVAGSPKDPLVRTIRAISYYKVPKRFKARPTCIKDFQILVPIARKPGSSLTIYERQAILYYAHLAYQDEGKPSAADLKSRCHKLDPNSSYGKLTR